MESKGALYAQQAGPSVDMMRSTEEDSLVDGPLISADALHSAIRREFQSIPTSRHAALLSVLHVVYVVLSVCLAVLCVLKLGQVETCASILGHTGGNSVVVFAKACLWVLVLVFSLCAQHHHAQARRRGYLRFYRHMQGLKSAPLTVHSTGNVLLLVVFAAGLSESVRTYMLLAVLGLELLLALPCLLYYTVKVMHFNTQRAPPDVTQEEHLLSYNDLGLPTETGFRESSSLEEVVEKQADLIEYLKQHNSSLSRRLLNLTAQH